MFPKRDMKLPEIQRVNILGVNVSAINMALALKSIDDWIMLKESHYVCVTGVHGIMECQRNESLRSIHNEAGLVTPDGMPLVWLSWWKGYKQVQRVYGPDLMLAVFAESVEKGYRHFLYGGGEGIAEKLAIQLSNRFPGIKITGFYSPPFRDLSLEEECNLKEMLHDAEPDIIWVGLSTPKQERWMAKYIDELNTTVLIGVGAAFDFLSGSKKQAPYWMQRSGLEWLFRLLSEPGRLWKRYLFNIPAFVILIFMQRLGLKRFGGMFR